MPCGGAVEVHASGSSHGLGSAVAVLSIMDQNQGQRAWTSAIKGILYMLIHQYNNALRLCLQTDQRRPMSRSRLLIPSSCIFDHPIVTRRHAEVQQ
jgi:hypothetical protein